jgi:hypothetical protein
MMDKTLRFSSQRRFLVATTQESYWESFWRAPRRQIVGINHDLNTKLFANEFKVYFCRWALPYSRHERVVDVQPWPTGGVEKLKHLFDVICI